MEKQKPIDLPPPYSSVVHSHPPLHPYLPPYGAGPGLTFPTQPRYIPQYAPPVVAPQVTQLSIPPSRKKNRCCEKTAHRYGGSVGVLLFLALLALGIWLGVRYGVRRATLDDDEHDDHRSEELSLPKNDTCSTNAVQCNGIKDCQMGTDETNCVRFGENNKLQVRTSQDNRFLPVCYHGWDMSFAEQTCAQLGFRKSYLTKAVQSEEPTSLALISSALQPIQALLNVSSSCPEQNTVFLQCVDCGRQRSTSRIIGGSIASLGNWPWQVSLHYQGHHVCGGVLIAPDFVVTAAHCFPRSNSLVLTVERWKVYVGMVSQDTLPQPYLVKTILLKEDYNNKTNDQDVALLRLTSPVTFNDKVQPVCLPGSDQQFVPGTKCWTTGFGTTVEGSGTASRSLMEVSVDIIDTQVCNSPNVYGGAVTKNMLCAGDLKGGKDSCQGDSGGPLVCQKNNLWYLAGITSWGIGCGRKNNPGVYTNVTSVLPWIYSNMQQERP
ncbi:transmembrane protease serine 13a [Mastacembelus armatus]|uniref:Transmembrane serine protease 13 n=1 Tax=Mastacembelus armatus TaxID=205130 RepID=A0A3Q3S1J6_9TELE|nr:transmembrane protease serine 13-like [Mastacembelus armatus]